MLLVTRITVHSCRYFLKDLINNKYKDLVRCIVRKTSDAHTAENFEDYLLNSIKPLKVSMKI
jgi:hypothetical protein